MQARSMDNKVAVVTGAGRGIGREIALLLAAEGASVVVNDLGVTVTGEDTAETPAQEVVSLIKARGGRAVVSTDSVAEPEGARRIVQAALDHFGRVDAIVNKTACFCLSEPDAGSDVYAMKTVAERDGDGWVLSGTKQWSTNSPYADYAMVFAVTDKDLASRRQGGITGFFVDTRSAGFAVPSVIPLMGHLGFDIGTVTLDRVRVRDDHRLGPVGQGLSVALGGVSVGRLAMAGLCTGLAQWALSQATEYARLRKTFGRPIAEHQAVQFMLAACAMDIYAARSMMQNCAWRIDQGLPSAMHVSLVKAFGTEMLGRVIDRCMEVHGAMGLTNELRLEAAYRFARILRIPDGTSEIQRRTVAGRLLAGEQIA